MVPILVRRILGMFKRFLSVMVVLAMLALPLTAFADTEKGYGRVTFSNPKISINNVMDVDMTGIDLECAFAVDASDIEHPRGTITGRVISEGAEVLGGAVTFNDAEFVAVVNGLSKMYGGKFADMIPDYEEYKAQFVSAISSIAQFSAMDFSASEIDEEIFKDMFVIEDAGEVEITFEGETVKAQKLTYTITEKTYEDMLAKLASLYGIPETAVHEMFKELGMSIKADFEMYMIDENTVYEVGTMKVTSGHESVMGDLTATIRVSDDGTVTVNETVSTVSGDDVIVVDVDATVKETGDFEDALSMTMTALITENDEDVGTMTMDMTPKAVEGGWQYDMDMTMDMLDEGKVVFTTSMMESGEDMRYASAVKVEGMTPVATAGETGIIIAGKKQETGEIFNGNMAFTATGFGMDTTFSMDIVLEMSDSIEGKIIDIANLSAIDLNNMTDAEQKTLALEAQSVVTGALAKLMQNPGFAALFALIGSTDVVPDDIFEDAA